ncbi:MAG: hypothetical protein JW844_05380 [Candidatus Omnitrophica bacterium]|nr:hypothetical protein [Candidatus Omnitrophota bacterium]
MENGDRAAEFFFDEDIFPVRCESCYREFASEAAFLTAYSQEKNTDNIEEIIEHIKNSQLKHLSLTCSCGSVITIPFKEKRGGGWAKKLKRRLFGEKLERLMQSGMSRDEARRYLLNKFDTQEGKDADQK